jgi:hypothetical protein
MFNQCNLIVFSIAAGKRARNASEERDKRSLRINPSITSENEDCSREISRTNPKMMR